MNTSQFRRVSFLAVCGIAVAVTATSTSPLLAGSYHPSGQEQQAIGKLVTDLQTIKAGSAVTDAEKQALAADLQVLATSTTKPSQASVDQLADDLADALANGSISASEKAQLILDLDAVFNSAGLSTAQAQQFIADATAILVSSGVDADDVALIASDLTAVVTGIQTNFLATNASFALVPASAGGAASGQTQLTSLIKNDGASTSFLSLETLGLTTGTYTVGATTASTGTAVTLGSLTVIGLQGKPGVGAVTFGDASGTPFPSGFDPADLASVSITDANGAVQLDGRLATAAKFTRLGNFRLMSGPAAPAALGNVAFEVKMKPSSDKTHFLLYAWKLPVNETLTLKINGLAVGTVTTNAKGRLLIDAGKVVLPVKGDGTTPLAAPTPLPAGTDLSTLEFLEIDDAQGQVVATAGFPS